MVLGAAEPGRAQIDRLLAVARREILLLAIAAGAVDDERAAVASARLRWAIGSARELVGRGAGKHDGQHDDEHAEALDRIANSAQRWLAGEPARPLHEIGGVIDRLAARQRQTPGAALGIAAAHASLVDLELDDLDLRRITLTGAMLTDLTMRRARCDAADARGTRWLRCELDASAWPMAVFSGARVEHGELSYSELTGASWHRASLSNSRLCHARLVDARLDRATFVDCSLRGADLSIAHSPHVASLAGAQFIRCDLRDTRWAGRELAGATFAECVVCAGDAIAAWL